MKHLATLLVFFSFTFHCFSQTAGYRFDNLTEKQGLADANIASILKDHRGYMWFASSEGLNRFDGKNCYVYHHSGADSNSLSSDNINVIFEDSRQRLWIGTRNGLNLYDPAHNNFRRFYHDATSKNSISSNEIWSLAEDGAGSVWIGTMGGGLNKLVESKSNNNTDKFNFISFKHDSAETNSLSDDIVWSIAFDKPGQGWIGTNKGLNRFSVKDVTDNKIFFTHFFRSPAKNSLSDNAVWRIWIDNELIWILSYRKMLDCIPVDSSIEQQEELKFMHVLPVISGKLQMPDLTALSVIKDRANNFWIGTDKQGLIQCDIDIDKKSWTANVDIINYFRHDKEDDQSLVNDAIYHLYEDNTGLVWIGSENGVSRYTPQKNRFNAILFSNTAISDTHIKSVFADKDHTWFASNNQLWLFNNEDRNVKLVSILPLNAEITSLHHTRDDDILIGTSANGIFIIYRKDMLRFFTGNDAPIKASKFIMNKTDIQENTSVFSFTHAGNEEVIVACYGLMGLLHTGTKNLTSFHLEKRSGTAPIFRCLVKAGDFYYAGTDNGLFIADKSSMKIFPVLAKSGMLSSDRINCLLLYNNELWIGTNSGLNIYNINQQSIKNYFVKDGLPDNNIVSFAVDAEKNIWIATRNGLCRFNNRKNIFSTFNQSEGLKSNQLNALAYSDSVLFIATDKGINTLMPALFNESSPQLPLVITDFKIAGNSIFSYPLTRAGKAMQQGSTIPINWKENNIAIEFIALEYQNPQAVKYSYMLEGFDKDWRYSGSMSQVNYTNLPGGSYTFRVKYADNNGEWYQGSVAVRMHVSTAWFKAWWFYLICSAAVSALVYSYYRIRLNRVIEIQKVRNKIARDLHDDIGSTLSTIQILSASAAKKIKTDTAQTEQMLKKIGDSSTNMMDAMRDIVWSIHPDNDSLDNMAVRMREYAARILEPKDILYSVTTDDAAMHAKLPLEKRKDVFLIFKEAINNLAKYSAAQDAEVKMNIHHNKLELSIKDNGRGFDTATISTGNGLKNMLQRAKNIGGELQIISSPGNGTTILLTAPIT